MIDNDGFRHNVGIILINNKQKVFLGKRLGQKSWQFPQGGVEPTESAEEAMFRELFEETGLDQSHVEVIAHTKDWIPYHLPKRFQRQNKTPVCIGQKQKWFLLKMLADDEALSFNHTQTPEFDAFKWVNYWHPINEVIYFKKHVYKLALQELAKAAGIMTQKQN